MGRREGVSKTNTKFEQGNYVTLAVRKAYHVGAIKRREILILYGIF